MNRGLNIFVNVGAKMLPSLSATATGVERRFKQMGQRLKVTSAEIKASLAGVQAAQSARWAAIAGGAGTLYAGARALEPFVTFEDRLVRLGNTAEVHGARLEAVGRDIVTTGAKFGTGASAAAEGVGDFVAAGLALDASLKALAPTLKLAKTSGIEITEASQAGIAVMQNLGVEAGNVSRAFDVMAKAGKLGRFELNDMAKAFPGLASRAKLLGMSGIDGVARMSAMLQPIREGARDADEAANNLLNFFDKLTGKETGDYFGKMGVDVEAVFNKAKREGRDFVELMLDEISRLSDGGKNGFILSKLFPDRQARQAALLLVQNRDKMRAIFREVLQANGTLDGDFGRISKTSKFGLDKTIAGLERIGIALGKAFGPSLGDMAERFAGFAERFADWADKHKGIVKTIGSIAAGLIGLRVAGAALGLVFGGMFGRLARLGLGKLGGGIWNLLFGAVGKAGPRIPWARIIGGMLRGAGSLLWRGIVALGPWILRGAAAAFGLLSNPVGWAIIAVTVVALIWKFRKEIANAWNTVVVPWFRNAWAGIKTWALSIDWKGIGWSIANALTFGLAGKFREAMANMPKPSAAALAGNVGMNATRGGLAGARARGGSVARGETYLVGEEGPELFTAGRGGNILPFGKTAAFLAAGAGAAMTPMAAAAQSPGARPNITANITIHDARDPTATAKEVERALNRLMSGNDGYYSD